ncbi:MAG: carboxyl transferase domain-containing protein [Myxococcota bacterium]
MKSFQRVAIVNRGEAAVRFLRGLRDYNGERGTAIEAVALYTDPDRLTPFVRLADHSIGIGPALVTTPTGMLSAYLDHPRVLDAIEQTGCDAVWPGWGFVAEDAAFVEALEARGITFIGPSSAAMRRLGDKIAAKLIASQAGVPMAAWHLIEPGESADDTRAAAEKIGFPLVVKASAGGGGRGIRVVRRAEDLASSVRAVKDEVARSFNAGGLFMEACVTAARHIEVQLVVDAEGRGQTFGIRDCSIQRRHQKVIEEAPSPAVNGALQASLEAAAVRLGEAVGYRGVGTVEFLVDPHRDFAHFLEVNTRLQVEHTITECVTGIDLVHVQLDVARGLPIPSAGPKPHGHAIEVRLNAEDPERGFQPAPGIVRVFRAPLGPGLRVDSGVAEGVAIAPQFDSMIAKLIAWGRDRGQAVARMARALRELELVVEDGATNKAFLSELLQDPAFLDASADTGWLDRRSAEARQAPVPGGFEALCTAAILMRQKAIAEATQAFLVDVQGGIPYRLDSASVPVEISLRGYLATFEAHSLGADRWLVGPVGDILREARLEATGAGSAVLHLRHVTGWSRHAVLHSTGRSGTSVEIDGRAHLIEPAAGGKVRAPAPAIVVSLQAKDGDEVQIGQRLCTLEAMKMEVPVVALEAGIVRSVMCRPNEQVAAGQTLFVLEAVQGASTSRSEPGLVIPPAPAPTMTVAAIIDVVRRRLVGGDVATSLVERAEAVLVREDDFRTAVEPEAWRPLAELVHAFGDTEIVFQSEQAFFGACRKGAIDPDYAPRLLKAVGHHGVTSLDRATPGGAQLDEALWRLAAARIDAPRRHRLVNSVLRALIALSDAGVRFDDQRELEVMLSRTAEVARADLPFVRDNARQARYLMFRRQRMNGHVPALSLGALLAAADDAPAILRAAYSEDAVMRAVASPLGLGCHSVIGHAGARSLAVVVSGALVATALPAVAPVLDELARAGSLELHLFLAGPVEADGLVARLLATIAGLPSAHALTRVAVSWTSDGRREHHRSWVPTPGSTALALIEEVWLRDVHPERARRLELWRLDGFALERLDAPAPVLAFKARARSNAKDERIVVFAELVRAPQIVAPGAIAGEVDQADDPGQRELDYVFAECLRVVREAQTQRPASQRYFLNRIVLHMVPMLETSPGTLAAVARRLEGPTRGLGIQKVVVQARVLRDGDVQRRVFSFAMRGRHRLEVHESVPSCAPIRAASDYHVRVELARRLGAIYPYEIIRALEGSPGADAAITPHPDMMHGRFVELDLDSTGEQLEPAGGAAGRAPGLNRSTVVVGLVTHATRKHPEGMTRVFIASDPTSAMGALAEPECRRINAALDLAAGLSVPVEWLPISSGARIAMDSGTENLDWTARVLRKLVEHTQAGHEVNIIVSGVNVGAQSYWNAMATMLMHTRGILIQTADGSMVLTGKKALEVSGSVAAEDERGIGGFERIMGPNGQAQVFARNLGDAYRILFEHYAHTYVAAGERRPRRLATTDPTSRSVLAEPHRALASLFSEEGNPGRKRAFAIRDVMRATIDQDAGFLERFGALEGGETAVVWDAHLGGHSSCVIGFESQVVARKDKAPLDGPEAWNGGTLFPLSSKKVARAINQASGNRPVVVLANLSGFDGSPESMRRWQLEHGAEIGRAVVNFDGPIVFVVIGRYHGGAYVVFSKALNPSLTALAVEGSYASVIGGSPAAAVVFPREVRRRAANDPRVRALQAKLALAEGSEAERLRAEIDKALSEAVLEHQGVVAREFDAIHTVERAVQVGSLDAVIPAARLRPAIIEVLDKAARPAEHRPFMLDGGKDGGTPVMA